MSAIAERVQATREMISKDRQAFCDRFGFPYPTVRKWERHPDPNPAFEKFCEVLLSQGVVCDETWLLTGKGISPYFVHESSWGAHIHIIRPKDIASRVIKKRLNLKEDSVLSQIKSLFKHHSKDQLILGRVRDNHMAPFYRIGDFCAGLKTPIDPKTTEPFVALLEVEPGRFIIRLIQNKQNQWMIKSALDDQCTKAEIRPLIWFHKNESTFHL